MRVSVIVNTYNEDPKVLLRAIDSYKKQCYQVIVSTVEGDSSLSYLQNVQFAVLPKDKHVGKSPKGSFQQINNALPLLDCDYFCWASGNDFAEPHKVKTEVNALIASKKQICYSAFNVIRANRLRVQLFKPYDVQEHLVNNFVSDCSMISKRMIDKYGPFDLERNNMAFWDFWLRVYENEGNVFEYNPIPTWNYMYNEGDMSKVMRKSPEAIALNLNDRKLMLQHHEGIIRKMAAGHN